VALLGEVPPGIDQWRAITPEVGGHPPSRCRAGVSTRNGSFCVARTVRSFSEQPVSAITFSSAAAAVRRSPLGLRAGRPSGLWPASGAVAAGAVPAGARMATSPAVPQRAVPGPVAVPAGRPARAGSRPQRRPGAGLVVSQFPGKPAAASSAAVSGGPGSHHGCVAEPAEESSGSLHTVHVPVSRKSAPSAPSATVLVRASSGGADGIGGADVSAPGPASAPAIRPSACGDADGADGALARAPGR
jgi:hypothetical protein